MTDYGEVYREADKTSNEMFERGIVRKTMTYYEAPDGTQYEWLLDAIKGTPIKSEEPLS